MGLTVRTPVQMRFADVDQFGHVNNTVQQAYFDLGKTDFFGQLWQLTGALQRVPAIIVSLKTDFYAQLHYGNELYVETQMVQIGHKSFHLRQSIVRGEEVCSCSEVVMVCFDAKTKQATEVPEAWREYLTQE